MRHHGWSRCVSCGFLSDRLKAPLPLTQVRGFHLENGLAALKDGLYTGGRRYGVVVVAIASGGDGSIIRRG